MIKHKITFKGTLKELIVFFNSNYQDETFDSSFPKSERKLKRLKPRQELTSICMIYRIYRSPDGLYVLIEPFFVE